MAEGIARICLGVFKIMKICVINGSPKGKNSVTLQTMLYLQKRFPETELEIIEAGQRLRAYEKSMDSAIAAIDAAELVVFCYPVYTFIVPYQLHRFIELLKGCGADFSGKPVTQISTSKHFYDVTAHRFIEENCADMGMCYIKGLSEDMDDLLTEKGQREAEDFWRFAEFSVSEGIFEKPASIKSAALPPYAASLEPAEKKQGFDTVIVTNLEPSDESLDGMIEDFRRIFPYETRVVNIAQYPFAGGCTGCFKCAVTGKCAYKDGFDDFLREKIQTADAIVYAFSIKDHSMGASFKLYDDRQFCNGHRTVTMGMPMGFIINGDYEAEANLKMIVEARCEVGGNYLAGAATDAEGIKAMSAKLCYGLENSYVPPRSFYGVGGMKIFRDLIYLMRGMMKADHKFYKKHGVYDDFPQRKLGTLIKMELVGVVLSSAKVQKKMGGKMTQGMMLPYKKVVDAAKPR